MLFLEKDLGASLLYFAVFVVMLWVASGRSMYLFVGLALFVAGAWPGYLDAHPRAAARRLLAPRARPDQDLPAGIRTARAGPVRARLRRHRGHGARPGIPHADPVRATDFIFAAIGEELGLLGAAALLLLYLSFIGRGLRIGIERTDSFGKLLATGLTSIVAVQTFVIVGGVTRLIPLTGVPLPLVSYGGSSLVAKFVILALLVRSRPVLGSRGVNRRIRRLGIGLIALFGLLFAQSPTSRCSPRTASATSPRTARARSSRSTRWSAERSSPPTAP